MRWWSLKQQYADKYRKLGLKIAYYRKLRGYTQEQLAEKLNMNPAYIGHVEAPNIDKAISMDTLFGIAEVLSISASKLLDFEGDDWYGIPSALNDIKERYRRKPIRETDGFSYGLFCMKFVLK